MGWDILQLYDWGLFHQVQPIPCINYPDIPRGKFELRRENNITGRFQLCYRNYNASIRKDLSNPRLR